MKLSELVHTSTLNDGDIVPIVQNGVTKRTNLSALRAKIGGTSGGGGGSDATGGRTLESFGAAGDSDDKRIGIAFAEIKPLLFKPAILLTENRVYGPMTTPRQMFSGLKLIGAVSIANQHRGANTQAQRVEIDIPNGAWLNLQDGRHPVAATGTSPAITADYTDTFDVEISRLSFYSMNSTTSFMAGALYGILWTSYIRDVGFSLFKHVLGSPSIKLLTTACLFDGWWNINNARGTQMTIGGSDNVFWIGSQCLLDSPGSTGANYSASVDYLLHCAFLSKTTIGHMFVTADERPCGVRITGSGNTPALVFLGTRIEGRNGGQSAYGSVVRMEGGRVTFRDCWLAYGFSNSALSQRTGEGGVVTVTGGRALFDGCHYGRAGSDGVADTVPWIYATGAGTRVRIANAETSDIGGTFTTTGLPHVRAVNSATIRKDDSVTQVAA